MNDLKHVPCAALVTRFRIDRFALGEHIKPFSIGLIDAREVMDHACLVENQIGLVVSPPDIILGTFDNMRPTARVAENLRAKTGRI